MTRTTPQSEPIALRARYVFPVCGEPLADAAVTIEGSTIVAVGDVPPGVKVRELGNVAILPGLINAHTHLEFSRLTKPVGRPGMGFVDWLRGTIASRASSSVDPCDAVSAGLRECLAHGTTTVAEIAQPGWSAEPFDRAGLEATIFLELIGPTPERAAAALLAARSHVRQPSVNPRRRPGLSPHAPYSVRPELLEGAVEISAETQTPVAFHLAESREELELLAHGTGRMRELLETLGVWDPALFPPGGRPLDYLRTLAGAHRALVIHGNYLEDDEIAFLAAHADRMAVVYCPRTHAHFDHARYPLDKFLTAGVPVALGTDSRASAPDLSMLSELRHVAHTFPQIPRRTILELATVAAARALALDDQVGSLEPNKTADLALLALDDRQSDDPHELILDSTLPVLSTYLAGQAVRG